MSATSQVTGAEIIPGRMGNGVAQLEYPRPDQIEQPFDPSMGTASTGTSTPIPGWVDRGSAFDNAQAISSLTGAQAVPFIEESVTVRRTSAE